MPVATLIRGPEEISASWLEQALSRSALELLGPALAAPGRSGRDAIHLDATLGLGGHAEAVLTGYPRVIVVGLDRDPQALRLAGQRLAAFGEVASKFAPVLRPVVYDMGDDQPPRD